MKELNHEVEYATVKRRDDFMKYEWRLWEARINSVRKGSVLLTDKERADTEFLIIHSKIKFFFPW